MPDRCIVLFSRSKYSLLVKPLYLTFHKSGKFLGSKSIRKVPVALRCVATKPCAPSPLAICGAGLRGAPSPAGLSITTNPTTSYIIANSTSQSTSTIHINHTITTGTLFICNGLSALPLKLELDKQKGRSAD
jgi:hypothetical protein